MLRFKNLGYTQKTNLNNGYSVISNALFNRDTKSNDITMYLKKDGVDHLYPIADIISIESDSKTLRFKVAQLITNKLTEGFFASYIKEFNEDMKEFYK